MKEGVSDHQEKVLRHYAELTEEFYIPYWDQDNIHFGLFEKDESIIDYHLHPAGRETQKREFSG
jgi:hypothetical protein